jgi:integrase
MATIKVKLRPSRVIGKAGVIYYQITHNRKTRQITTKLRVHPTDWDGDECKLTLSASNRTMIQTRIDSDVAVLSRIVSMLDNCKKGYTVDNIVSHYKLPCSHIAVLDYMRTQVEHLRASNRLGTAQNYKKVMCSFSQFLKEVQLPLSALTESVIADYNAFLIRRGLARNSVSFYMRVLRAIYNKAARQKLIEQQHPFTDVYTGIDQTRKRAVSESIISQLYRLKLEPNSQIALSRDLFIFSYCTRGMAFVDIAYLKRSNLQNGVLIYTRRKTGQLLSIKVELCIQKIIDRYACLGSAYLFPIITATNPAEAYEQYQAALNRHNRLLGKLSEMLGCGCKLTSYTSRHSWATAARNHNVPISVISQGMGHTSEHTTRIYLTMLENSVIDEANRGIIESIE